MDPSVETGPPTPKRPKHQTQDPEPRTLRVEMQMKSPEPRIECYCTSSSTSSSKSSPEPRNLDAIGASIHCPADFFAVLKQNISAPLTICGVRFVDKNLPKEPKVPKAESPITAASDSCDHEDICKKAIEMIHEKYVEPLMDLTGYRWVRKEIPSRGRGLKVLLVKYGCSQEIPKRRKSVQCAGNYMTSAETTGALPGKHQRGRQLSHPLKQFECNSYYCIKYTWLTQEIDISYTHCNHAPYKRLPDKLKPSIMARLDMKAQDLYDELLVKPVFEDIR